MCPVAMRTSGRESPVSRTEDIVAVLSRVDAYPERPARVARVETHISWVFLTDRFAYKLKKCVVYDFLDFSTAERRERACRREVELNRRTAPQVYLGVLPITRSRRGNLALAGSGEPVDWVVKMHRLPADRSLDALIRSGRLCAGDVQELAARLSDLYQQWPPLVVNTSAYRERLVEQVLANRRELLDPAHGLPSTAVRRAQAGQQRLLATFPALLEVRAADGRVVEGHGDLRPEHVYFNPSPCLIDCIEFNDQLRQVDVLDELSFLAMECDALGMPWIGRQILGQYCQASGDCPPASLHWFYKSYRACVRAKVLALRADQHDLAARRRDLSAAADYLQLASGYASHLGPPLLVIVRGPAGSGKSTLAGGLAKLLGMEWLQTDAIRREGCESTATPGKPAIAAYDAASKDGVYEEMFERAGALLREGLSVVLDGTFLSTLLMRNAALLGVQHEATTLLADCQCPVSVAIERIAARLNRQETLSEATPALHPRQRAELEPPPAHLDVCPVDTTVSPASQLETVLEHLRQTGFRHALSQPLDQAVAIA
jgi:aminoglycoside phosphotransferase family enzyme/predicted kinase